MIRVDDVSAIRSSLGRPRPREVPSSRRTRRRRHREPLERVVVPPSRDPRERRGFRDFFRGVPPAISDSLTSNMARRSGLRRQGIVSKLLEIFIPSPFFPPLFSANVAKATAPAAPPSSASIRRMRGAGMTFWGVVGAISLELELACSRRLLGEKVRCRAAIFRWLFGKRRRWNWFVPIPSFTLPELLGFY